jgi:hypothetical protein
MRLKYLRWSLVIGHFRWEAYEITKYKIQSPNSHSKKLGMKNAVIIIWGILWCVTLSAQTMEQQVRTMFTDAADIQWVEHYKGRMSDINDVAMTLAYDGKTCKGIMWYLRSKAQFRMEGQILNDTTLMLTEYDTTNTATGKIEGIIKKHDGIKGSWFSLNKTIGEQLNLLPTNQEPRYPGYCGDNKWIRKYSGTIGTDDVEMVIRRANNGYVKGTVYYKSSNKTHLAEGQISDNGHSVYLEIQDLNWNEIAVINAKVDFTTDNISGKAKTKNGEVPCDLTIFEKMAVGCMEYADFLTKTEITYPKTKNQDFNTFIKVQIQDWSSLSKAYTKEYSAQIPVYSATQRSSLRSYCWYEIDCFSSRLISGKIIQTNTWDNDYQGFSFNYDLIENKEITLESIFKEEFDHQDFINRFIKKDIKKRPYYSDGFYETWITNQKFEYYTFRREGLVLSTKFNGTYGEQQVTIPYELLIPYLKDMSIFEMVK